MGNGFQNATVWGSGFMNDPQGSIQSRILQRKGLRKLDVRAVRGPLTRQALLKLGHNCPEIYGDPAILMPLLYTPAKVSEKQNYVVVSHMADSARYENSVPILTDDYAGFVDRLCGAERVISSSLHGIILAESYGIPAVLFLPEATRGNLTLFKYQDYYYGTHRTEFPVARTIEEALAVTPCPVPDMTLQRAALLQAFPADLWK